MIGYSGFHSGRATDSAMNTAQVVPSEVHSRSKAGVDCIEICREAVSCNLKLARRGRVQLLREGHRIPLSSPSEMPRQYQLAVSLDSDEAVGVSAPRVVVFLALLFAS